MNMILGVRFKALPLSAKMQIIITLHNTFNMVFLDLNLQHGCYRFFHVYF
jgi:hypothetical protein